MFLYSWDAILCRCPDTAPIKDKMNYASSKDALRKIMGGKYLSHFNVFLLNIADIRFQIKWFPPVSGIKHDMQFNDLTDCGDRSTFASKLAKNIINLEGQNVSY